jgi:hypothetical protein
MSPQAITQGMTEILMECHEREMLGQEPMNPQDFKYTKSFYTRGLIELRYYHSNNGRPKAGFYVTLKGKKMLASYDQMSRKSNVSPV